MTQTQTQERHDRSATMDRDGAMGGKLTIQNEVVAKIAGTAAREVPGVYPGAGGLRETVSGLTGGDDTEIKKGIKAEVGEKQAAFDIAVTIDYGLHIPDIVRQMRERIAARVREMTGLETTEVNVDVIDINLEEQGSRVS